MDNDAHRPADAVGQKKSTCCTRTSGAAVVAAIILATIAALATSGRWWENNLPTSGSVTSARESWTPAPQPQGPSVTLRVDFGNGVRREYLGMPWHEGMTAGDLIRQSSEMSPGLTYQVRGSGKMTLLTSLDGVANGDGDGRYWLYEVDGRRGEVSFEVQPIEAGASVLWVFAKPE